MLVHLWPWFSKDIDTMTSKWLICCKYKKQNAEPLKPTPCRLWQQVATDLFEWIKFLWLTIIYATLKLHHWESLYNFILKLKTAFVLHGISEILVSNSGPQFSSQEFQQFLEEYDFEHTTSSLNFLQANGEAEQAVKTV